MFETIWESISSDVLKIVLAIISVIVSYYIIPSIKDDLIPFLKEKRIYSTVKKFVQAAEKLAESVVIKKRDKKKYVVDLLEQNGITITPTLDAFIESAVEELDKVISITKDEILKEDSICDENVGE